MLLLPSTHSMLLFLLFPRISHEGSSGSWSPLQKAIPIPNLSSLPRLARRQNGTGISRPRPLLVEHVFDKGSIVTTLDFINWLSQLS
ncbi:uncharacterized protein GGS22DRAFT_163595 [Annulohypoxylon maeteangense]|uniref:uncharacterized protein n=1 Tax=Annulohypoxylon maeteangense TaxID=1927788 RepID=UPI002007BD48|nr:uncharacterized protein GGS22DRAFT_163595 [Annulohypoxylon maeteangense]KAI0885390.1 hypothetical protein GGS22DRAFT_163595 [Annulohypoxylon maeteangense]